MGMTRENLGPEGQARDSTCLRTTRAHFAFVSERKSDVRARWRKRVGLLLHYVTLIKFLCLRDANPLARRSERCCDCGATSSGILIFPVTFDAIVRFFLAEIARFTIFLPHER